MTPEEQVISLLDFLRERGEKKALPELIPSSQADWDEWLTCAVEQGVAPLLYFRVKRIGMARIIPDEIVLKLRQEYHQNAARNLRLLHELKNVVTALNEHDIPVMPLKGAFLAFHVYDNPALRVMGDIDILVPLSKIRNATSTLNNLGYTSAILPWEEAAHHTVLISKDKFISLEVHWGLSTLANDPAFPVDELWSRASQREDMGTKIFTMAPENLLIHICQHAAIVHLYVQGLRALCDIDLLTRKYEQELDWAFIASQTNSWKLHNPVGLTLRLCQQFLDTPLSQYVIEQLKLARINSGIVEEAVFQIASSTTIEDSNFISDPLTTKVLTRLLSERKPLGMLTLLFRSIFRPANIPAEVFSEENKTTFYLRRLLYLTGKYTRYAWKRLFTNKTIKQHLRRQKNLLKWLRS